MAFSDLVILPLPESDPATCKTWAADQGVKLAVEELMRRYPKARPTRPAPDLPLQPLAVLVDVSVSAGEALYYCQYTLPVPRRTPDSPVGSRFD